ncbi:hypothetical protein [Geodermatophilus sp. SYSU D00766]
MAGLESLYTPQKVYRPLADALDIARDAEEAHYDRFSVQDGGIESQVARHCALYPGDPDVAAYRALPSSAFDSPAAGTPHGIRWLSLADIHHSLTDNTPVVAFVVFGRTVFFRVELSAVKRQIERPDGEDENAYTALVLAVTNHLRKLRVSRWVDDVTRAARENVNWGLIMRRHHERGIRMRLGGVVYDLAVKGDRTSLKLLGAVGSEDDPERRKKLLGARLTAMSAGGAALAEDQMPYGWHLDKDSRGRPRKVKGLNLVPVADASVAPALAEVYGLHAAGTTYEAICGRLAELEKDGGIRRRAGQRYDLDFAAALGDRNRMYDAALTVFRGHWPDGVPRPEAPSEETVLAYEAGGNPAELFTLEQRLLIARPELLRTGVHLRAVVNDIRERGLRLAGLTPRYADDYDETGVFYVEVRWPWPVDPASGAEVVRFGIPDRTLRLAAGRLLRSLRAPRKRTGGQAHVGRPERRVLQGFGVWLLPGDLEATMIARANNDGRANLVLLVRAEEDGRPRPGQQHRRGWTEQLSNPQRSVAATCNLDVLCGDVAYRITEAITAQLDPAVLAPVRAVLHVDVAEQTERLRSGLLTRAKAADEAAAKAEKAARGARTNAALASEDGDEEEAAAYREDAADHSKQARRSRQEAENLRQQAAALDEQRPRGEQDADTNLSSIAYLVAGLQRAASSNGSGPATLGTLADKQLRDWRAWAEEDEEGRWILYEVTLHVPVVTEGHVEVRLRGRVQDVRPRGDRAEERRAGKSGGRAATAETVFAKGLPVDDLVTEDLGRKTLFMKHVMPWLAEHAVTARGAKCALVDHPVAAVRQVMYAALTGIALPQLAAYSAGWRAHVATTYLDAGLQWGNAACPDDTTLALQLVATLGEPAAYMRGVGLDIAAIARHCGISPDDVRELVVPTKRGGLGFDRPQYLAYADDRKTRVRIIACPHGCRRGRCDIVALLPEVAASGYGVLCSTCWRAPNTTEPKWATIVFPPAYGTPVTRVMPKGTLRTAAQTVPAARPLPLAIAPATPRRTVG